MEEEFKEIKLTRGFKTKVSIEDYEEMNKFSWHIKIVSKTLIYAQTTLRIDGKKKNVKMHQMLLGKKEGFVIDHINGDGVDNRRSNLRHVTVRQNAFNAKLLNTNMSDYPGVRLEESGKYSVHISKKGINTRVGIYNTKEEAISARENAEIDEYGEKLIIRKPKELDLSEATPPHLFKRNRSSKNKYKGVTYKKGKWRARFKYPGCERKYIGHFDTEIEAAGCFYNEFLKIYGTEPFKLEE